MLNTCLFSAKFSGLLLAVFFASALHAQQNTLKFTPLQPAFGKFSIHYERAVGSNAAILIEYQRWFESREKPSGGFSLFGLTAYGADHSSISGNRLSAFYRFYDHAVLKGRFVEIGLYTGRHDITTVSETTVLNPFALLLFDPAGFSTTTTEVQQYKNVRVSGLRAGLGWHKTRRNLSLEISGGASFNGNSANIRPTFGMKPVSLYSRFAVGFNF